MNLIDIGLSRGLSASRLFLPRDAVPAQYNCCRCGFVRQSISVRLSVRHKPVLYRNEWTNRAGFGTEASFHLFHTALKGKVGISKY